ncbi:MAG: hypothetical protein HY924_01335 [Elusimicrobia bacterium]|nr:hypothetical protein [Elusimicrobiota bacterium]
MKRMPGLPACAAAAALAVWAWAAVAPAQADPRADDLKYETSCERLTPMQVSGSVTNRSDDIYVVEGTVRFAFLTGPLRHYPDYSMYANASILPGERIAVAWTSLPFSLQGGDRCVFHVAGAIRKR